MRDEANFQGGFDGTLQPGTRPTLLVVDLQRGFTEVGLSPLASNCDQAVASTNELIASMRGVGDVIFTVISYAPNLQDMGCWGRKSSSLSTLVAGTAACELDPRLDYDPARDIVLHKKQASAFFGTPLAGILAARLCDMVVVTGATTSGCVRASVVDAMQYGFPPFVVAQGVADRSSAQHASNLVDMSSKYAEVVDLPDMVAILSRIGSDSK
ncbi:Nicotinamidase-related amidase OS=Castellaniella defragrans OX=75697 GN=HNR28_000994 PE=4 SV=1 [Castellaniella defragrans]